MYLSFYGLKIKPFQHSTNPSFFWLGEMHKEVLAIFKYGILKMPGILVLTGDIGTGKTTLINVLINNFGDKIIVVKVPDPGLEEIDFMNYVSDTLDFKKKFTSKDMFFAHFSEFLNESFIIGKKVLLVIDECQRLSSRLLEEIIKLSNIGKDEKKALKLLLIGQNAFNDLVLKNNKSALHELISINYAIAPLDLHETGEFVRHRLKIAGAKKDIFTPDAITKIYQYSDGIPRRINIICDHALLIGFGKEKKTVNGDLVRGCAKDLRPHDFSKDPNIDLPDSRAGENFEYLKVIPPESRKKVTVKRAGKIFGVVILIILPIFLITYFTDPITHRNMISYVKTSGMQILNTFHGTDRQELNTSLQPDREKISIHEKDTKTIGMMPQEIVPEEESTAWPIEKKLPDEKDPSASEVVKDGRTDVRILVTTRSSWRDGLPDITPVNKDLVDGNPPRRRLITPAPPVQQDTINLDTKENDQFSPDTAGMVQPTTGPGQRDAAKIEKEIAPEIAGSPADVPKAELEMPNVYDDPDIHASDENNEEDKEILIKQNELKVNSRIAEDTEPKARNDLPETLVNPDKSTEAVEILDDVQENVDPGAIIDWVIKKRSN